MDRTPAEQLIDLDRAIRLPAGKIVVPGFVPTDLFVGRVVLAIKFASLPPATVFRAIAEEWGWDRIVRETY